MLTCAILDDYQNVALKVADWERLSDRVIFRTYNEHFDSRTLPAKIEDCDIVVLMRERTSFSAETFARLPRLRLLAATGMSNSAIDMQAASAHGVFVCGTSGPVNGTPELTWTLIHGLARHIRMETSNFHSDGPWQSTLGIDLEGKCLGLVGLGKVGGRVAQVGTAFGMRVLAWSQNLTAAACKEFGAEHASSLQQLVNEADIVSVHLRLGERTRRLIGAPEIGSMKQSAFFINTSRSEIVDTPALIDALRRNAIAGAGIDVFDEEPLPTGHPFRSLPNVFCTPHIGGVTEATYRAFYSGVVEDIEAWLMSKPTRVLNPSLNGPIRRQPVTQVNHQRAKPEAET